jgi:hypothetical protein
MVLKKLASYKRPDIAPRPFQTGSSAADHRVALRTFKFRGGSLSCSDAASLTPPSCDHTVNLGGADAALPFPGSHEGGKRRVESAVLFSTKKFSVAFRGRGEKGGAWHGPQKTCILKTTQDCAPAIPNPFLSCRPPRRASHIQISGRTPLAHMDGVVSYTELVSAGMVKFTTASD